VVRAAVRDAAVSETSAEKRFEATPARRERAKREGNAARSHELASIAAFAGALLGLIASLPLLTGAARTAVRASTARHQAIDAVPAIVMLGLAAVPALCAALAGTSVALMQGGGLRFAPLKVAFERLAPLPGLKRMAGGEAVIAAARAGVAFVAVAAIVTPIGMRTAVAAMASASPSAAAGVALAGMVQACFAAAGAGALFAFADYALVRRRWLHSLKMTFDEFKRDAKEQEGDPHTKSRRKALHRTFLRGGISRVHEASFVVVNPTHIAIALRYAPPGIPVPEIIVRAADALALDVRALAERARIPVVEDIALARLLWRSGDAGRPIPAESFVAVATAIAALIRAGILVA
jgi:flagellar biosynthesis protein FlhB